MDKIHWIKKIFKTGSESSCNNTDTAVVLDCPYFNEYPYSRELSVVTGIL